MVTDYHVKHYITNDNEIMVCRSKSPKMIHKPITPLTFLQERTSHHVLSGGSARDPIPKYIETSIIVKYTFDEEICFMSDSWTGFPGFPHTWFLISL
jgi:hypothetical protein